MMSKLALLGGEPVLTELPPPYPSIGPAEIQAVEHVTKSGCLSGFYGSWSNEFFGGPVVREFEAAWRERFDTKHAISVNSATSGLIAAMGAIGVSPGDEVIVPPLTMSATAMAPLLYGGIPVFADVEAQTFCLDSAAVRTAISERTKAILAVNLFGHPAALIELRAIADEFDLYLVEDNAQAPLATDGGQYTGTVGDIGVFSLNYHKHIHTGEGGMCVTDDDDLAQRLQLIRNHGENVVESLEISDITNLIGFNFRLTELSAAVGIEQLRRIDEHVERRCELAESLTETTTGMIGLTTPFVRSECTHVYYVWSLRIHAEELGVSRELFSNALRAEGFPHGVGYCRPLYMLPLFQQQCAIGRDGFPFHLGSRNYGPGLCPVAERLFHDELIIFEPCAYGINERLTKQLGFALEKVYENRHELMPEGRAA